MQFKEKLMKQTWENNKKTNFGADFGPFLAEIWSPKFFFVGFISTWCYTLLQAIIVCNLKENLMNQTLKIAKKPSFESNFAHLGANLGPKIVFCGFYIH